MTVTWVFKPIPSPELQGLFSKWRSRVPREAHENTPTRDMEKSEPSYTGGGNANGAATVENSMEVA